MTYSTTVPFGAVHLILAIAIVASACERRAGQPDTAEPVEAAAVPLPPDTVTADRITLIGDVDGSSDLTFGMITSLAADAGGRLYVSDAMASDVRVFSPSGAFLHRIGRSGDGPGEFRRPFGLAIAPSGALYVADETRVQRFTPTSDAAEFRYAGSFPGPAYGFGPFGGRVDEHGRYFFRRAFGRIPDQRYFYIVFDSSGNHP